MKYLFRSLPFVLSGGTGAMLVYALLLWVGPDRVGRLFRRESEMDVVLLVGGLVLLITAILAYWFPRFMAQVTFVCLVVFTVLIVYRFVSPPIEYWTFAWKPAAAALVFSSNAAWLYQTHIRGAKPPHT